MNKKIIYLENLLLLLFCIIFYFKSDHSILLFVILFFLPDISILFYLVNEQIGRIGYNFFHSYSVPLLLLSINFIWFSSSLITAILVIWVAHISLDRGLGMGLKEETFKKTHLQKL
ncbi:DUF4260 family protein [Tetragenococcus koreensis]|uniref:DUF4260 domain-containing protein n=1 Tax=Tetragenococcus koreensis TaxID=290335 RepID=A0AAN4RJ61_9ENTE|nr:DUF4260 family protein [Tetragenococcus koreensis]AYW45290.1 DUF4260 domain-containing protein [Tetragenococcus koreensis]MCF1616812.1 DUF4260 domain-containing protein [Tetragenococcus koreensis]MDN6733296.1 DUF4260 domain-containing protein [Tetragenococcus koreensis]GEN90282.1 hypothetical protein TKO01_03280 [Tetragenococcus koreensis]GEQ48543.1 hypothetical protein TK11N_03950 [Tetragenococcus koreensis]